MARCLTSRMNVLVFSLCDDTDLAYAAAATPTAGKSGCTSDGYCRPKRAAARSPAKAMPIRALRLPASSAACR